MFSKQCLFHQSKEKKQAAQSHCNFSRPTVAEMVDPTGNNQLLGKIIFEIQKIFDGELDKFNSNR